MTDDILNHIPTVDEIEPLTGDVEERLRAAFQLYIDGEIADVAVRARIETLKSATPATERIFSEQAILSDTMRQALKPLKPAPQFAETVGKAIETATQSGRATTIGGLIALGLVCIAIIGILVSTSGQPVSPNAAKIERGTLVLASGERLSAGGSLTLSDASLSTTGALTQPSAAAVGALIRIKKEISVTVSRGAMFRLFESKSAEMDTVFETLNAPVRYRFSTRSNPLTVRLPGVSVRIPALSDSPAVKDTIIEVFVREDSATEIIVVSSNAELITRDSDGTERAAPLPERTRVLISATGSVLERTILVGEKGLGWRND
ncbi:MAG: hypothetical protein ABIH86_03830 [Planctomycetota bacterium]